MRWLAIVGAAIVWIIFLTIVYSRFNRAFFFAYLAVAAFYWVSVAVTRKINPLHVVMGADGRLSTSKFQFFVWTGVIVFAYVLLFSYRGRPEIISSIPQNVLLALGFSVATAVGAKGITVSYLSSSQISKPASSQPGGNTDLSALVTHDDSGTPDLTKIQMLIWTIIAAAIYLHNVYYSLSQYKACAGAQCAFPDIDTSLMVLMGLSQGAYLGNKLVAAGSPQISSISPSVGVPGIDVTISGQSLGTAQNGNLILINGQNVGVTATTWTDTAIHFSIPQRRPDGSAWQFDERITIGIVINGQQTSSLTFAFASQPAIVAINPKSPQKASQVTITGRNFGAKQANSRLWLSGQDCTSLVNSWSDTQIQFTFLSTLPGGGVWQPNIGFIVQVGTADDFRSNTLNLITGA
jgi:hypothetical protein